MPAGDVFEPPLADPKQPHAFASALWGHSRLRSTVVGVVAYGENIGLVRWRGTTEGEGLQVGLDGAVFAQFDLHTVSAPLLNADFTVGVPLSYRRGPWSARLRVYHQSSHLGDDYLLAEHPDPVHISYESVELLGALDRWGARLYAGGEVLVHRIPNALPVALWQLGLDYRYPRLLPVGMNQAAQLVAGVDARRAWSDRRVADVSVRAGAELGPRPDEGLRWRRRWAVLAEYRSSSSPFDPFFSEQMSFLGVGVHFFL